MAGLMSKFWGFLGLDAAPEAAAVENKVVLSASDLLVSKSIQRSLLILAIMLTLFVFGSGVFSVMADKLFKGADLVTNLKEYKSNVLQLYLLQTNDAAHLGGEQAQVQELKKAKAQALSTLEKLVANPTLQSEEKLWLSNALQDLREKQLLPFQPTPLATTTDTAHPQAGMHVLTQDKLHEIEKLIAASRQRSADGERALYYTMAGNDTLFVAGFILVGLILYRARKASITSLSERAVAQQKAEAENEQLNHSAISLLGAISEISQRDLTVRAPVTQDVIGTVSDSINLLTEETSRVLKDVTDIAHQVKEVSNKVKSQAEVVSRTAESERVSVNDMMNALFSATQTMNQVAALTEQSNTAAGHATQVTNQALETVNGTVKGMGSIRETIAETEKRIKRLGERSQEISGIVSLINTISERTHVLALNASMQAAVAGEAGRGFAVVAEEVQRLAESSRNATQQISTLVNNIQTETNETINTVNRTIGQVVQGSEQAQKAGEQMRQTQEITSQLVAQVRSIAQASDEQKAMSARLLEYIQRIGDSTKQTADQIESQNQETETLLAASRKLVDSVKVFKLPA